MELARSITIIYAATPVLHIMLGLIVRVLGATFGVIVGVLDAVPGICKSVLGILLGLTG